MNKIYQGHALEVLKTFPDESVNCVITSPPYWGLRDYGIESCLWDADPNCEHEWGNNKITLKHKAGETNPGKESWYKDKGASDDKGNQFCLKCSAWKGSLGLEPTPELYIKHLLEIFDEIKRVLRKDGTCWANIGDSYSGSPAGNKFDSPFAFKKGRFRLDNYRQDVKRQTNIPAKSLVGIPEMFVLGMRDRGWIRRNTIVWYKRNCMPSSAKDRFTVDFEYVYFFTKTGKYWFEQQFDEHQSPQKEIDRQYSDGFKDTTYATNKNYSGGVGYGTQGRNKRCVWNIPTQPFSEAHFAVFPEALVEPMVKSGCPEFVCKKCGKAREKIYKKGNLVPDEPQYKPRGNDRPDKYVCRIKAKGQDKPTPNHHYEYDFKGFTDCNCNANFEPGIVLDPFCGSGTTLRVAEKFNRRWIGIDLNPKYIEMAKEKRLKEVQKVLL